MTSLDTMQPIILYGFHKEPAVPSGSAFCQKLEAYFRFARIQYTDESTTPQSAPKGKLPYVKMTDGTVLCDSHFIIRHCIKEGMADLDLQAGLTNLEKAESVVWKRILGGPCSVTYTRWMITDNYRNFIDEQLPEATWIYKRFGGTMAHYNIASCLKGHGVGRHSLEEVEELVKLSFSSLETRLQSNTHGKWFFGEKGPSEVDAAIYGVLATISITPSTPLVNRLIAESPILTEYILGITESHFLEYQQLTETLRELRVKQTETIETKKKSFF